MDRIMRSSLVNTPNQSRMRVWKSRHNTYLYYSSAAIGTGRNAKLGESSTTASFFPRKQEFARKRFLYFSSAGTPNGNTSYDNLYRLMTSNLSREKKRNQPKIESVSLIVPTSDRLKGDLRNVNFSVISIPSSITHNQRQRWYSTKIKVGKLFTVIVALPPLPLAPFAPTSAALISTSSPTPSETPRATMEALSKDVSENVIQDSQADIISSIDVTSNQKDIDSSEKSNESIASKGDTEKGWKRVMAIKVPQYGPDADKAVRSLQIARKERARIKTSINVQRALYGNMVICVAKLGAWFSSGSSSMMSEFV